MTWIQLLADKLIEQHGKVRQYHAGDCIDVGKQTAYAWVSDSSARLLDSRELLMPSGSGLVIWGSRETPFTPPGDLEVSTSALPAITTQRNCLLADGFMPRKILFGIGFNLLSTWQVAVPLMDYKTLARDIGSEADRERARETLIDLRVPVYDTRMIFVRRCPEGEALVETWSNLLAMGEEPRLAFLRAVWAVKPLILPLPFSWMTADGKDGYEG